MYYVYIVECADKTLYTGCTNNLEKRIHAHNTESSGAKYPRARRPVKLVYSEVLPTLTLAYAREAEIKRFTKQKKLALIKNAIQQ